jgi:cell division inhibitor SulA
MYLEFKRHKKTRMCLRETGMSTLRQNKDLKANSASDARRFIKRRMTEVIIPQAQNSNHILFPLVASLSKQEQNPSQLTGSRWVTWITDRKPNRQQLDSYGSNNTNIRIIHTRVQDDNRWIIWEALSKGNSHTVIADITSISTDDITQFESAARQGQCVGILARSMNTSSI